MPHTPSRIRIAQVIQNLNYGGMERVLHSLAEQLPGHGFDVHVVVLDYLGRFAEGLEGRVTFHQVPPMPRWSMLHPAGLIRTIRAIGPDIVHSHTGLWLKAARSAHLARVPVVVHTEHGRPDPVPWSDRLIDNCASRWTHCTIAVSDALAGVLRDQVVHDPARVTVITNGVDVDRLQPGHRDELRRALNLPMDGLVIGSIGRLEPVKNYELALRALARLGPDTPATLVLAGDGSMRQSLEQQAGQLGISDRVRFLGWRNDTERLYGAFDIFSLTSHSEGTSISLLEAMSSGVCPLVTDVGGNRAVLGPSLSSLLVAPNEDEALAAAWVALAQDPARRAEVGAVARARVQEHFSLTRMVDQHVALYHKLLAGPGGAMGRS